MVLGYWIVGSGTTNPDYTIGDIVNIGAGFVVPPHLSESLSILYHKQWWYLMFHGRHADLVLS